MTEVIDNFIEMNGIAEMFPHNSRTFKQFQLQTILELPPQKPDMEQVIRVYDKIEILKTRVMKDPTGVSYEGQILTGKKLMVEGYVKQKIEYIAEDPLQSVHEAQFTLPFSSYIILGEDDSLEAQYEATGYIEDIYIKQIGKRKLFKNVMILLHAGTNISNMSTLSEAPYQSNLFTQLCITEETTLPSNMPDVEQLLSCMVDPELLSIKVIHTMKGLSYEGQYLTGKKVALELKLKQKILYAAGRTTQSVHVIENEFCQSAYIIVPCKIEGTDPEYLIEHKYLKPEVIIEDIYFSEINKRSLFKNICVLLKLVMLPTYELCCSLHNNCNDSSLNLIYNDGLNSIELPNSLRYKKVKPKWSPCGNEIAFLSNSCGNWMLYLYNLGTSTVKRITDPKHFKSISGYSWSVDGRSIYVTTSIGDTKEIFRVEIRRRCYKQLTFGEGIYSSSHPKCSPDGKLIAFIRSFTNRNDLWIMKRDGTDCKRVTSYGNVSCFDWSAGSSQIAFACSTDDRENMVCLLHLEDNRIIPVRSYSITTTIKKIRFSFDGSFLAYLLSDQNTDNLSIYHFEDETEANLTGYSSNTRISDFTWNTDASKLYYSANEMFYYNIHSVELNTGEKVQLTFSMASRIDLDYRPRIT